MCIRDRDIGGDSIDSLDTKPLTIHFDKNSLTPELMEHLLHASNLVFPDLPEIPEFINLKEYDIVDAKTDENLITEATDTYFEEEEFETDSDGDFDEMYKKHMQQTEKKANDGDKGTDGSMNGFDDEECEEVYGDEDDEDDEDDDDFKLLSNGEKNLQAKQGTNGTMSETTQTFTSTFESTTTLTSAQAATATSMTQNSNGTTATITQEGLASNPNVFSGYI